MHLTEKELARMQLRILEGKRRPQEKMTARQFAERQDAQPDGIRYDLLTVVTDAGLPIPEREYVFHPSRKWAFDFAWEDLKIALEYEGLMSEHSRHTTLKGYEGDCRKYTAAQLLGWIVIRFTILTPREQLVDELKEARESR